MRIFGLDISFARKDAGLSIDTVIRRIEAAHETFAGVAVTPENCMESPTVKAIVTAIGQRMATLPIRVMQKETSGGRTSKKDLPSHPVAKLLQQPNGWQDSVTFWLDATSWLVRYGNFYAHKSRGSTGPIRELLPLNPSTVTVEQDADWRVKYRSTAHGQQADYDADKILHARLAARNGVKGDSPVMDVREAIALEITAERMGSSVFGNGAMPGIIFKQANARFESDEEEKKFLEDFQALYAKRGRFKAMVMPFGMDATTLNVENEKAQFLATRQYQRTVIAGAFGVPPHMVGDLSKMTYGNVEQQNLDFVSAVVLPYARVFEAAMERSLLTDEDRRGGVIIRFNLDGALRGDFKSRQEGLKIQREAGVICPNDWREIENMNPISEEDGGNTYWLKGPSGQGADETPKEPENPSDDPEKDPAKEPKND